MSRLLQRLYNWLSTNKVMNIDIRYGSWILSCIIFLIASSFITGYFLGEKNSAEHLQASITREAFADQIYNSLCVACSRDTEIKESETDPEAETDADYDETSESESESSGLQDTENAATEVHTQYYAQLAGYTSLKRAEAFAERAIQKNVPVLIKERTSTTPKGCPVTWYQVVTEPYEDQDALNSIVAILKKEEKLHDVKIVQG